MGKASIHGKNRWKWKHKHILAWNTVVLVNWLSLFSFPFLRSILSFSRIAVAFFVIALLGTVSLARCAGSRRNRRIAKAIILLHLLIPALIVLIHVWETNASNGGMRVRHYEFSCGISHSGLIFDEWWEIHGHEYEARNITKDMFKGFPFRGGVSSEVLFLNKRMVSADELAIGDIGVYRSPRDNALIASRFIGTWMRENRMYYLFKGDNLDYIRWIPYERVEGVLQATLQSRVFGLIKKEGCLRSPKPQSF